LKIEDLHKSLFLVGISTTLFSLRKGHSCSLTSSMVTLLGLPAKLEYLEPLKPPAVYLVAAEPTRLVGGREGVFRRVPCPDDSY
jgi:hypothetical protein